MFRVEKVLAVVLIAVLIGVLMYECIMPTGFLYPYLHREEETPEHRHRLPFGLFDTASKVGEVLSPYATAWNLHRKVLVSSSSQEYFWVFVYYGYTTEYYEDYPYTFVAYSSPDGFHWSDKQRLVSYATLDHLDLGQNLDVRWDNELGKAVVWHGKDDYPYWGRLGLSDGKMIKEKWRCFSCVVNYNPVCCRYAYTSGYFIVRYQSFHPEITTKRGDTIAWCNKTWAEYPESEQKSKSPWSGSGYSSDAGQTATFAFYEDKAVFVTVNKDYTLWWGWAYDKDFQQPPEPLNITISPGYTSLSGCSEPELNGFGVGKVHIVYIKDNGQLCHMSFDGSSWSGETVLVEKGASCPVIACGENGRLYVFYISNGVIKLLKFDGDRWLKKQVQDAFPFHTYNNPAYLSTNQVVQHGKICLVWTEQNLEGDKPYAVWFGCIEDG